MRSLINIALVILCSCGNEDNQKHELDVKKSTTVQKSTLEYLQANHVDDGGLLLELKHGGDSALWQGEYCAVTGCDMFEYQDDIAGKFCRDVDCDVHLSDDDGNGKMDSNTSWAGDPGICGLIPYALLQGKEGLISDHIQYGEDHNWSMGEVAEGLDTADQFDAYTRLKYSKSLIRLFKNVRAYLQNRSHDIVELPFFDTSKDDFEAHLQACHIWAQSYMLGRSSDQMRRIIGIHHRRVPEAPFYAFLHGWLNGDWEPIQTICESEEVWLGDYIRCDGSEMCGYADKVWACDMMIKAGTGQMGLVSGALKTR